MLPLAIVLTITFGKPIGCARIPAVAMTVTPPPTKITLLIFPSVLQACEVHRQRLGQSRDAVPRSGLSGSIVPA